MKSINFKDKIEKQIVETIQSNDDVHAAINSVVNDKFVEKETSDQRFDRMMNEIRIAREKSDARWDENNRKWHENQNKLIANDQKWEQSVKQWEENQKKLVANDQKWEECLKHTEETNRKWDESQKQWQENNRKWDESRKQWDESAKDREENNRKWEENQKKLVANDQKWEESVKQWQENNRKWEENNREWHENQKAINDLISNMDTKFENLNDSIKSTVGALGARWGIRSEQSFRNALKGILEKNTDFKVLRVVERDESGVVFGRPDQVELDIVLKNGKLMIIEIKSSVSSGDVLLFTKKA